MSRYQSAPSTPSEPSTAIDFDYASMSVVKQRRRTDCGIAAVATVGGVQYEVAKRAIFGDEPRTSLKTTPTDLRRGLAALGVIMGMLGRAVRGRWSDVRPMTGVAMVRVGSLRSNHWVVFASKGSRHLVLDPADGTRMSCEGAARNGLLPVEWFDVERIALVLRACVSAGVPGFMVGISGGPQHLLFRETESLARTDGAAYVARNYRRVLGAWVPR